MPKKKKKIQVFIIVLLFLIYFFIAARPVKRETILNPKWINSFETETPVIFGASSASAPYLQDARLLPFTLGNYFGYINTTGGFAVLKINDSDIYLSDNMWTEYEAEPSSIEIKNITGDTIINIENARGYPVLLDNRVFILGSQQNSLSEIDNNGNVKWTYEFGSVLTCIDAASGLVMTGSIDGIVEILNSDGMRSYMFQPGGSRLETIYGCAISRNGLRIGIVAGIDPQRFLLLEKTGPEEEYRVIYHEFLEGGFRRHVRVVFIDNDSRVVYERQGGIGCYNIRSRRSVFIPLDGELEAIDESGNRGFLFLITSRRLNSRQYNQIPLMRDPQEAAGNLGDMFRLKECELVGIRLSKDRRLFANEDAVFLRAPFKSEDVYLGRTQSSLIVGGGSALISFDIEER